MNVETPFGDQILNDGLEVALEWGPNLSKPYGPRLAERQPQLTQPQLAEVEKICKAAMDFGHNLIYEMAGKSGLANPFGDFEPTMKARYPWISAKNLSHIRSQGMYYAWKDGIG